MYNIHTSPLVFSAPNSHWQDTDPLSWGGFLSHLTNLEKLKTQKCSSQQFWNTDFIISTEKQYSLISVFPVRMNQMVLSSAQIGRKGTTEKYTWIVWCLLPKWGRMAQTEQYTGIVLCLLLKWGRPIQNEQYTSMVLCVAEICRHKLNNIPLWFYTCCSKGRTGKKWTTYPQAFCPERERGTNWIYQNSSVSIAQMGERHKLNTIIRTVLCLLLK